MDGAQRLVMLKAVVGWIERKLPVWAKIVMGGILVLTFAYTTVDAVAQMHEDVNKNTAFRESAEPMLKFLVCRSIERDAGRETGACIFLLRESDLYDEFVEIGVIRR